MTDYLVNPAKGFQPDYDDSDSKRGKRRGASPSNVSDDEPSV